MRLCEAALRVLSVHPTGRGGRRLEMDVYVRMAWRARVEIKKSSRQWCVKTDSDYCSNQTAVNRHTTGVGGICNALT